MALQRLLENALRDPQFERLVEAGGSAFVSYSLQPYLIAAVAEHRYKRRPLLVVVSDDHAAKELTNELTAWLGRERVRLYPSRGVTYESHLMPPAHLVGLRVAALDSLLAPPADEPSPVVVASVVALTERVPDPSLRPHGFKVAVGQRLDLDSCTAQLVAAGYERCEQVEDRGQFAVRGGLLDIFPATADQAVRVDLFGDEVESLRLFSTFTQRSLESVESVEVSPAAEIDPDYKALAELEAADGSASDITELLPLKDFKAFLELIPDTVAVSTVGAEQIDPILEVHWQDVVTAFHGQDPTGLYVEPKELLDALSERSELALTAIEGAAEMKFHAQAVDLAARSLADAEPELEKQLRSRYLTALVWARRGDGERAMYSLTRLRADWLDEKGDDEFETERLLLAQGRLQHGFVAPQFGLAVYPDHRLLKRRTPTRRRQRSGALRSFSDLTTGDYVVHEDHGIARFAGFETKTVAGITRDYLYLEYKGEDRVFVPSDQLAKITRYVGAGGSEPQLSKLGGKRWEQMKARARSAAAEIAGELLNLYAERKVRSGFSFTPDGELQRQLEDSFRYRETPDQLVAIEQIKGDMEGPRPMDRLLCGDVGFGKTEVALRAACKAVASGKQVLVLAPTTILAQQHYGTFSERFRDLPFNIDVVSRFRTDAQQQETFKSLSEGKVDILIGTHRLLSRDVAPKDLGLLVIDEEQRFGVKQKEAIRQLRLKVDVLAMSATPIPRTLQMSLAGVRDISVLETPPEGRRPVRTYVGEYDEQLVKQAVEREIARDGQVFFLHNRVETIEETAARLRGLCPAAVVEIVHGQLQEEELERRMFRFMRGESNLLVCTSIIESGLDIPQANTLIVERAENFGLSQLHQIRGRVGRGHERGFAYLLYPSSAALTKEAAQRLAALSDFTDLGVGFKIAMRDLELRGAGSLLGDEQSGHVAALGFELYLQMLDETVKELAQLRADVEEAGEEEPPQPVRLDVAVDAYVPADYIPYERAKIDVHRRIASAVDVEELGGLREELLDRFGELPDPLVNLLTLQEARIKLGSAGAKTVTLRGGRVTIVPIELGSKQAKALRASYESALYESGKSQLSARVSDDPQKQLKDVLDFANSLLAARFL